MQYVDLWATGDEYTVYPRPRRPEIDTRIEIRQEGLGVPVIATELPLPQNVYTPKGVNTENRSSKSLKRGQLD